jgi:hypothetical protein
MKRTLGTFGGDKLFQTAYSIQTFAGIELEVVSPAQSFRRDPSR